MKKICRLFLLFFAVFALRTPLFSDVREENIDLFLVLDKSLSMVEEIDAVKSYVENFLVDAFLIPGDNLTVIDFFGSAETIITRTVDSQSAKELIKNRLDSISADGRYTDIGNALDVLNREVTRQPPTDRKRYLLLITDGIQEAPPESIYYSPDGRFNHFFLENTKTIQRAGWKIQIIGIGDATAAREVAEELSAAYAEVMDGEELTPETLERATAQITGTVEPSAPPRFSRMDKQGNSVMTLALVSSGYTVPVTVRFEGVYFSDSRNPKTNLKARLVQDRENREPLEITLAPGEEQTVKFALRFPPLPRGKAALQGDLFFVFSGETPVTPALFTVSVKGPSPVLALLPWLAALIVLILLAVLLILFLRKRKGAAAPELPMSVSCRFQGRREVIRTFPLSQGERVYVLPRGFSLDFSLTDDGNSLASAELAGDRLLFTLNGEKDLKPRGPISGNILGKELQFTLSGGQAASLLFTKVS